MGSLGERLDYSKHYDLAFNLESNEWNGFESAQLRLIDLKESDPRDIIGATRSENMKILVIGSGGREHALVWKIAQSPLAEKIYCAPGNPGTAQFAENVPLAVEDLAGLKKFALEKKIGLTVVGPEVPLVAGIADEFAAAGLKVFGPGRRGAQIEGSKVFSKNFMTKYDIPTAQSGTFRRLAEAIAYVKEMGAPIVVKADGLAAGKGVVVCQTEGEAIEALKLIMEKKEFGSAGDQVVIEEFLAGEEASILALTDGKSILPLASAQDHKRVRDGDQGPNTGGDGGLFAGADRDRAFDVGDRRDGPQTVH